MLSSFANRMTGYFAALLIASISVLFFFWYFGFSPFNLEGAKNQEMDRAIQLLEAKINLQKKLIAVEINERRGDLLMIAESDGISKNTGKNNEILQTNLNIKFQSLLKAYPNRFKKMIIIDPKELKIMASTMPVHQLTIFNNNEFFNKAKESTHNEVIDAWNGNNGEKILAMAHKIQARNEQGELFGPAIGILIAVLDLDTIFKDGINGDSDSIHEQSSILIRHDEDQEILTVYPEPKDGLKNFQLNQDTSKQFIGTKIEKDFNGINWIVVYRKLSLGKEQTWSIIYYTKRSNLLTDLHKNVNKLLIIGFIVMMLVLSMIHFISRRLTWPLKVLSKTAVRLGRGNLYVRFEDFLGETHEIQVLSRSFNDMAASIQNSQQVLEDKIIQRTEKLKRAEAMHFTLFNASMDAVIVMDNRCIVDCNPATLEIFGASVRSQIINQRLGDFSSHEINSPEGEKQYTEEKWQQIQIQMQSNEHLSVNWVFSRLDTHENFDAEVQVSRVNHAGQLLFQITVRDITIKKRIEAALLESEQRHRTLVEWSPECINVHRKGIVCYVNTSAVKMMGATSSEQLIGKHIREFIHPDYHHLLDIRVGYMTTQGEHSPSVEMKFCRADGFYMDVVVQTISIPFDGERSFYSAWHDVTQLKKNAEAQRIAASVFESQEGMLVINNDWKILRVNHSFIEITGYAAKELMGKVPYFFDQTLLNPEFLEQFHQQINQQGAWQGEIINRRKDGHLFPAWLNISSVKNDDGATTHYVGTFSDITERKAIEDEIRNLAFYDPLTQLPNRRLLIDRLKQAIVSSVRDNYKGALLFIDLDNFKMLNDTLGHDKGDLLLQIVAERLLTCTRDGDTVARLGGDEFVVMLEDLSEDAFEASRLSEIVASKIISALNQPYWLGLNEHRSSPSIGVTLFGEKVESIEEPLKRADLAMYQAKAAGRNTARFYDPKMQVKVNERAELEENLRDAMMMDHFELYYQAQMSNENKLIGAEVLIRWNHPSKGIISPLSFIPIAEEMGLISILGYWVLDTACRQLVEWESQAHLNNISISVNVSPSQFNHFSFVDQVFDILEFTGANPRLLKLELTEGFSITDIEDIIQKMTRLKERGIGLSLDDFGTGYSSLSYLKRLPLEQLKIDQSFVRDILIDPNDAAISKMVIVLAESLGLSVIAEGVETIEQKNLLAQQGCYMYQGYLFSRPIPIKEFEAYALDS
jgi:diguanylate cyclase (GGDEF)-like protein/PAS domain S-box-containing protein